MVYTYITYTNLVSQNLRDQDLDYSLHLTDCTI